MALRRLSPGLRGAALFPAAAYLVHQVRYLLAYGDSAGHELQSTGHAYLASLVGPAALIVAIGLGLFVARVARAWSGGADGTAHDHGFLSTATAAGLLLIGLYIAQESLEGLLLTGHPTGLGGVLGDGGWIAVLAAHVAGVAIAAILRVGSAVVTWAKRAGRARRGASRRSTTASLPRGARRRDARRTTVLAARAAGRAPPRLAQHLR